MRPIGLHRHQMESNVELRDWALFSPQKEAAELIEQAASELLHEVFGKEKNPGRLVYSVASLPLGTPVELEVIFEVE